MRRDKCIKYAECLPQETLYLIIMPCKNCATKLIIKYYYKKGNHAHFLIISDHEEIQEWESECKKCERRKGCKTNYGPSSTDQTLILLQSIHTDCCELWWAIHHCVERHTYWQKCLPTWHQEQSIWKWPMHLTQTLSWMLSTEWSIGGGFKRDIIQQWQ